MAKYVVNSRLSFYEVDYKILAEARQETIKSQKETILLLQQQIDMLKQHKSEVKPVDTSMDKRKS